MKHGPGHAEQLYLYALRALPGHEMTAMAAHLAGCARCRRELEALRPAVDALASWPADVLPVPASLEARLAERTGGEARGNPLVPPPEWNEPEWEDVAPRISVKMLANDTERNRVTMLVKLAPGGEYPPHTHAGVEELHLLEGELWIDDRKLYPGDYNRGEPGTSDKRVWSETGCTCVLIASPGDVLS